MEISERRFRAALRTAALLGAAMEGILLVQPGDSELKRLDDLLEAILQDVKDGK
jgi:hypothetical protein